MLLHDDLNQPAEDTTVTAAVDDTQDSLDELHDELKTSLMSSDVMVTSFHPQSEKPALWNPEFHVLRAPFAGFAFRRMDVRDIVFCGHNRKA